MSASTRGLVCDIHFCGLVVKKDFVVKKEGEGIDRMRKHWNDRFTGTCIHAGRGSILGCLNLLGLCKTHNENNFGTLKSL